MSGPRSKIAGILRTLADRIDPPTLRLVGSKQLPNVRRILALADAYQVAEAVADHTLSYRVFGDSHKLSALRSGADITTRRYERTVLWFADNWPADATWPTSVQYPHPDLRTQLALSRAIAACGSQAALARRVGVTQQAVSYWVRDLRRIPGEWVVRVEKATGIPRHELRPDIFEAEAA